MNGDLMGDVWENSPAKGAELLLLLAVAYFADEDGYACETVGTLAGKARMSTSSVIRATSSLEEKGLMKVVERGQGRAASRYHVPRSGVTLQPQAVRSGVNLTPLRPEDPARSGVNLQRQVDPTPLSFQSDTTTDSASGSNLTPQNGSWSQSDTTTAPPMEGTRAGAHARVGWWERTTPPTNPPTGEDHAHASARPLDPGAVDFMASMNLQRTPQIHEQREISDLYTAKISAGFTDAEIRNSIGGDWEGVRNRVRTLIWRFKQMPEQPMRPRTAQRAPSKPRWECTECGGVVVGPVTTGAMCPSCWIEASEGAEGKLAELAPNFKTDLLDEARKYLEANGWRPSGAVVPVLAAELINAHDLSARAAQVLAKWDGSRAKVEREMQKGSAA